MWLGLVKQRCLKRCIERSTVTMSPAECVKLLDAAMQSHSAEAYLDGMLNAFDDAGREEDSRLAASLRLLCRAGEIEVLMSMRAEWLGLRTLLQPRKALGL